MARRTLWLIVAGAGAFVVVLAFVAVFLVVTIVAGQHAIAARTLPGTSATITQNGKATALTASGQNIAAGETIAVKKGIVELRGPKGLIVRLNAGSTSAIVKQSTRSDALALSVKTGRVYVAGPTTGSFTVRGLKASTALNHGRVVVSCLSDLCDFQALEEPLRLQTGKATLALAAHEDGQTGATGAGYTAPDALRADTWITANTKQDRVEGRKDLAVTGQSIIGNWSFSYTSKFESLPIQHPVVLSPDCNTDFGCTVAATSVYDSCPTSFSCTLKGEADVPDATASSFTVYYDPTKVACDAASRTTDGSETMTDVVTTATGTGTRSTTYTPDSKSAGCAKSSIAKAQTIPISATRGAPSSAFPATAAQRWIAERVLNSTTKDCHAITVRSGFSADVVCDFTAGSTDSAKHKRAHAVEFAVSSKSSTADALFKSISAKYTKETEPAGKAAVVAWHSEPSGSLVTLADHGSSPDAITTWINDDADFSSNGDFYFLGL